MRFRKNGRKEQNGAENGQISSNDNFLSQNSIEENTLVSKIKDKGKK